MKRIIIYFMCLLFLACACYAEPYFEVKCGLAEMRSAARTGYIVEAETGQRIKRHSIGLSIGNQRSETASGNLYVTPVMLQYKYDLNKRLSVGLGAGWGFIAFKENYAGKATADSSRIFAPGVEYKINKHWSMSARYLIGDLKIESGNASVGILEEHSRLDSVQVLLTRKF